MTTDITTTLLEFLTQIGIPHRFTKVDEDSSLPGAQILNGEVLIETEALSWPGDILYAAGLIATAAPSERLSFKNSLKEEPTHELTAMAWAYSATQHLKINPRIVFHEGGYKSGGEQLIQQLQGPQPFGAPILCWYQMCETFPLITHWLRTVEDPSALSATS